MVFSRQTQGEEYEKNSHVRNRRGRVFEGAVGISATFWFPNPPGNATTSHVYKQNAGAGDLDKVLRTTLDGLEKGGLLRNDAQVAWLGMTDKRWADAEHEAGALIRVWELAPEPLDRP